MNTAEVQSARRSMGLWGRHYPEANTAAVVTIDAATGQTHVLFEVHWSYSGNPTGGRLTVTSGDTTLVDLNITAGGPDSLVLPRGLAGVAAANLVVTLAAGGEGVTGKLQVNYN
jgi:hypothetical protein